MRVNVEEKDMLKLSRLSFLKDAYKNRWLFSYNDYYLAQFLLYYKQFKEELYRFNHKYNKNNKLYSMNFANNFIELEDKDVRT